MLERWRTSSCSETARRPRDFISDSNVSKWSRLRLVRTRSAPALARARARFWPRPRLVPVTIATRPVRSKSSFFMEMKSQNSSGSEDDFHQVWLARVPPLKPLWPVIERDDGGDKRIYFDVADAEQVVCTSVFNR